MANIPPKPQRDVAIESIFATIGLKTVERSVFVNCSVSIPQIQDVYAKQKQPVPERAMRHAINQSWYGILGVLEDEEPRETVFVHVDGVIVDVVHSRNWLRVHEKRVIFSLNWLPKSHPYMEAVRNGMNILPAIGDPMPRHSAFLYM